MAAESETSKSWIIIEVIVPRSAKKFPPVHPGEILREEFLVPLNLSQYRLARRLRVPPRRINEIVLGKRSITADTALRLARFFDTSAQFWMNLQTRYDLDLAQEKIGKRRLSEIHVRAA